MARRPGQGRTAPRRGQWAERLAALWLRCKGYRILARRLGAARGSGAGEIDLVVRRGALVAFVEVKWRPTLSEAAAAILPRQRRRIARAAAGFLAGRPDLTACAIRFDAVLVAPGRLPRHLPDAWRPDDAP